MASFYALQRKLEDIPKEFLEQIQSADVSRQRELNSAVKIQSWFRALLCRLAYQRVVRALMHIQRYGRTLLAKKRILVVRAAWTKKQNLRFFHHCASVIQKFWRGFWSRKKLHDFYKRKRYLNEVVVRGDRTVKVLREQFKAKVEEVQIEQERATHEAFAELTSQLHHLVSTRHIDGVFNTVYAPKVASVFDKPLEQHLRDNCRVGKIKSLRAPLQHGLSKSARADYAGTLGSNDTQKYLESQVSPPSQPPPSQRTPRAPRMVTEGGKVLPMKSPRYLRDPGSGPSPKSVTKLPSLV